MLSLLIGSLFLWILSLGSNFARTYRTVTLTDLYLLWYKTFQISYWKFKNCMGLFTFPEGFILFCVLLSLLFQYLWHLLRKEIYMVFYPHNDHFLSLIFHSLYPFTFRSWKTSQCFPQRHWFLLFQSVDLDSGCCWWDFNSVTMFYISWNNSLFYKISFLLQTAFLYFHFIFL